MKRVRIVDPNAGEMKLGDEKILTTEQVCRLFNITKGTLSNWLYKGQIPSIKIGRKHFFKESTLLDWMSERENIR